MLEDEDSLFVPSGRSTKNRRKSKRRCKTERNVWKEEEMLTMLDIFKDYSALELLNDGTTNRSEEIFKDIEKEMCRLGFRKKSYRQIWAKWNFLKSTYTSSRRANTYPRFLTGDVYLGLDNILWKQYGARSLLRPNFSVQANDDYDEKLFRTEKSFEKETLAEIARCAAQSAAQAARKANSLVNNQIVVKREPVDEDQLMQHDVPQQPFMTTVVKREPAKKILLNNPIPVRSLPKLTPKPLTIINATSIQQTPLSQTTNKQLPPSVSTFRLTNHIEQKTRLNLPDNIPASSNNNDDNFLDDNSTTESAPLHESSGGSTFSKDITELSNSLKSVQKELIYTFFKKQEELLKMEMDFQRQQDARLINSFEQQNRMLIEATQNVLNGVIQLNNSHNFNHFMYMNGE